jgi:hypothetical protein
MKITTIEFISRDQCDPNEKEYFVNYSTTIEVAMLPEEITDSVIEKAFNLVKGSFPFPDKATLESCIVDIYPLINEPVPIEEWF